MRSVPARKASLHPQVTDDQPPFYVETVKKLRGRCERRAAVMRILECVRLQTNAQSRCQLKKMRKRMAAPSATGIEKSSPGEFSNGRMVPYLTQLFIQMPCGPPPIIGATNPKIAPKMRAEIHFI